MNRMEKQSNKRERQKKRIMKFSGKHLGNEREDKIFFEEKGKNNMPEIIVIQQRPNETRIRRI